MQVLGIDVGGSGIKGAMVDLETGMFTSDRIRIKTPSSFGVQAVTDAIARLVGKFNYKGAVGIGFPAVVSNGIVLSPATAHEISDWVNQPINDILSDTTGCKVSVLNDADAAGLAEIRYGAGKGIAGLIMTVTLGTGVGGGLFMDDKLVPNLEIGKLYLAGHDQVVEQYMAGRIKKELGLNWTEYGNRVMEFCRHIERVFSPQIIIIGGGVSKNHKKFLSEDSLKRSQLVPARMRNRAGITGAAIWAAELQPG